MPEEASEVKMTVAVQSFRLNKLSEKIFFFFLCSDVSRSIDNHWRYLSTTIDYIHLLGDLTFLIKERVDGEISNSVKTTHQPDEKVNL